MFHKVGFKFLAKNPKLEEALHQQLTAITLFNRMTNDNFKIPSNYRREHYRVPVTQDLPFHLLVKVYIKGDDDLYHGCNLMDISAGGFLAVMPFENQGASFKTQNTRRFIFEFGGNRYKCDAVAARCDRVDLSKGARLFMQKLGKIKTAEAEATAVKYT